MKKIISLTMALIMALVSVTFTSLTVFASGESVDAAQEIACDASAEYTFDKLSEEYPYYWFKFTPAEDGLYQFKAVNKDKLYLSGHILKAFASAEDAKAGANEIPEVSYNEERDKDFLPEYFIDVYELKKDVTYYIYEFVYPGKGDVTAKIEFSASKHVHEWEKTFTLPSGHDLGECGKVCKTCGLEDIYGFEAPSVPQKLKLKAGKNRFTAKWSKVKGVKGYEIKYSTSKKFKKKSTKTVTVKGNKKSKKTVKGVKKNKVYYVKIRCYTVVEGNKVYSKWSGAKKVKTLK